MSKSNIAFKANELALALHNLSLPEIRIIQLAIVETIQNDAVLSSDTPLRIGAPRYANIFETTCQDAYKRMKDAEEKLFNRRFSYVDQQGKTIKSRWIQQARYFDHENAIELVFTTSLIEAIRRIDELERFFSSHLLEQTAKMDSVYAVRLYELIIQWRKSKKTPLFELGDFRQQLGLQEHEYQRMGNFKSRVLDLAVKQINEHSDIKVSYHQVKKGRVITGFEFFIKERQKPKSLQKGSITRDADTADMFTVDGLTDKQLWRISRHKDFISAYSYLAKGDANKSWSAYSDFMINEIKKDASKFSENRDLHEYLDGSDEEYNFSR